MGWEVGYLDAYGMWAETAAAGVNEFVRPGAITDALPGWLDGLAFAPDQWDFTDTVDSGRLLVAGGCLLLHGADLDVERRW